jgi:hypothetical protein
MVKVYETAILQLEVLNNDVDKETPKKICEMMKLYMSFLPTFPNRTCRNRGGVIGPALNQV